MVVEKQAKTSHFQWPWKTSTLGFKVMQFFDAEFIRNGTRYRHDFNARLIGTYTCPTRQCHFVWPWVILSDLEKYSMTRSVARSLCDSWASWLQDGYLRQQETAEHGAWVYRQWSLLHHNIMPTTSYLFHRPFVNFSAYSTFANVNSCGLIWLSM